VAAKAAGVPEDRLHQAQEFQRKSQWRLDFIAAENSMGFHAPQEAARVLAEAIDYARQGQLALLGGATGGTTTAAAPAAAPPGSASAAASAPPPIPSASASR
jgi:nitrite reductase (cytochrome c-552)